jgi:hypothetical protein
MLEGLSLIHRRRVARMSKLTGTMGDSSVSFSITNTAADGLFTSTPVCPQTHLAILNSLA